MPDSAKTEWRGRHSGKDELRSEVWSLLKQQRASLRDPFGHIPNFVGADRAADRLASMPIWKRAKVVKCNPDAPQAPVRLRALKDGKRLYMAVPRLTKVRCFVELTAEDVRSRNIAFEQADEERGKVTGTPVGCTCGDGVIDWKKTIEILKELRFNGVLSVECGTPDQAARSLAHLQSLI